MDFALDDDQALIVQTVRRFVDKDLRGWAGDADRAGAAPVRLTTVAGELGFFTDAVPEAAGGLLDGPYPHLTRALRGLELGRGCSAMAALLECNVEPALAVARWGSAVAQAALFASLVDGGRATTGRDARGRLALTAAGDGVRVTGTVGPLPALAHASHVLLCAHQGGAPVVLLVPTALGTVTARAPSAWRAAAWGTLALADAEIPGDHVVARGADGADATAAVLAWHRTSLAARATGVAIAAIEHARHYGTERVQFGRPIGQFEALIGLADDADTASAAARLMTLHAAWLLDRAHDGPSWAAAADAASRARVVAADAVGRATVDAVQIFGGYGFVNDYPVEKLMRDARPYAQLVGDERFDRILAEVAPTGA
ncbi:MAG: acyl-CoA dehydrogenase family protein [Kofleriaceae bacterium]